MRGHCTVCEGSRQLLLSTTVTEYDVIGTVPLVLIYFLSRIFDELSWLAEKKRDSVVSAHYSGCRINCAVES